MLRAEHTLSCRLLGATARLLRPLNAKSRLHLIVEIALLDIGDVPSDPTLNAESGFASALNLPAGRKPILDVLSLRPDCTLSGRLLLAELRVAGVLNAHGSLHLPLKVPALDARHIACKPALLRQSGFTSPLNLRPSRQTVLRRLRLSANQALSGGLLLALLSSARVLQAHGGTILRIEVLLPNIRGICRQAAL